MKRGGGSCLRVGIVGVGGMGAWHAARWKQLLSDRSDRLELTGFYDVSREATAKAVEEYGGQAFESLTDLLAAVDVVDICTPTSHHKPPVLAAAAAGKDIVCEKPLARHLRDAEEMVAACQAAGVRLFVAQVVRFFRQFSLAKAILDSGALGSPGVFRSVRGGSPPHATGRSWFSDFEQSGGVVMDVSIHDIDFARWCFGDVERVFARGLYPGGMETRSGVQPPVSKDHALIILRFENGVIGHIEGSWAYPPGRFRTLFEIAGDQGLIEFDSMAPAPLTVTLLPESGADASPQLPDIPRHHSPLASGDDPYYLELEHFVNCLENGDEFLVSPQDGLEAVRVALAAIESLRTGEPVDVATFTEE
jgi:predicted dehydrogenase